MLSKFETRAVRVRYAEKPGCKFTACWQTQVGVALGEAVANTGAHAKTSGTADSVDERKALAGAKSPTSASGGVQSSKALSLEGQPVSPMRRKVAILAGCRRGCGAGRKTLPKVVKAAGALSEDRRSAPGCDKRQERRFCGG